MAVERFPIEATHIMMFARAIGDENPAYVDPSSVAALEFGNVIAPPTFVSAALQFDPEVWRPRPNEPWFGSGRQASGVTVAGSSQMHAEQHYEYHKPLVAGMVLTVSMRQGASWVKSSKRGGSLLFEEQITEFRDEISGQLMVTGRQIAVTHQPDINVDAGS